MSPATTPMDFQSEQLVLRELDAGERLLWAGQPDGGIRFRKSDIIAIPFSLMWGGFALFWNIMVWASPAPLFFRLWGLPFLLVGVYITVGRFFIEAWRRRRTFYGVTDRRILIISGMRKRTTSSFSLRTLPAVTLVERRNGFGDVLLTSNGLGLNELANTFALVQRGTTPPTLELVPNARHVYDLIRQAQQRAA